MKNDDKYIEELRIALEEEHGQSFTQVEANQAYQLIKLLAQIMADNVFRAPDRQSKLKGNPKGFHPEEGGTCGICGAYANKENSWYDKNGIKCVTCQKAIDKRLIPISVIKNRDSWYSIHDLERHFFITRTDLNKYVKQGFFKKRTIPLDEKQTHFELFLIADNKDVLPPKKLLPSKIIKFEKDREQYYTHGPWYECIDEKGANKLLKYRICEILKETFPRPINSGGFYWQSMNSLFTLVQ